MGKPIVIVGSNGQLGSDLMRIWPECDNRSIVGLTHKEIEVAEIASVRTALKPVEPAIVINTSAFHRVDDVERDPGRAFSVNDLGARNLALVCRELDAMLIHLSTDYVFSGKKEFAYLEYDTVDPINMYGVTKAAGEMAIRSLWHKHCIVRTSGLYGITGPSGKGSNFVELMLRLGREGKPIRVVNDQVLTPTPTHALARQLISIAGSDECGMFHATCQGECSWFEFAAAIFRHARLAPDLSPQSTAQSGAVAARPRHSVLHNSRLQSVALDCLPHWEAGLEEYLRLRIPGGCGQSSAA